ncbi:MAG TPA: arginyltransferase [Stellaceae bacterium]|nr:arginyltransferase [Stellaceae bacterium]
MNRPVIAPLQHFYRTSSLACPYVEGRMERKVITELEGPDGAQLYNALSRAGFRRSHHLAYRPACPGCSACVPVRVDVARFETSRSTRRLRQVNADLTVKTIGAVATIEHYRMFQRYQRARHGDSDMAGMGFGDYRSMIEDSPVDTVIVALHDQAGQPAAACLIDRLDDGLSAVYSFYEVGEPRRSLGTFMVLSLIDHARALGLPYVYLGYWIAESRKMAYKTRFRPLEGLGAEGWQPLDPASMGAA